LGATFEAVQKLCDLCALELSNINGPGQIVLAGEKENIGRAIEIATEVTGGKALPLNVAGAFHSSWMEPARKQFDAFLGDIVFEEPKFKVMSNVTGEPMENPEEIKALLIQQIVSPVRWWDCMRRAKREGINYFYECGVGKTLANMAKRIDNELRVLSFGAHGDNIKFLR
jgi:[acyl-carrier-protein] S-malonyltransferase